MTCRRIIVVEAFFRTGGATEPKSSTHLTSQRIRGLSFDQRRDDEVLEFDNGSIVIKINFIRTGIFIIFLGNRENSKFW